MASIAAAVSVPTFSGLKAETRVAPAATVSTSTVVRMAPVRASASSDAWKSVSKALVAGAGTLLLAASANAATIEMGNSNGELKFFPSSVKVASGEAITFVNIGGFPHNIKFDEDNVPSGVNADAISHEDLLNAPKETYSVTLKQSGSYRFYCEPHEGSGMEGTITVS